jgi:hypothetical protein
MIVVSATITSPTTATTIASVTPLAAAAFARPVLAYSLAMFLIFNIAHWRARLHFAAFFQRCFS